MIELDVRDLEHPVPLGLAVDAFKKLSIDEVIHMIHRKEPRPLFEILFKNGGFYHSVQDVQGLWHIYILRNRGIDLEAFHV